MKQRSSDYIERLIQHMKDLGVFEECVERYDGIAVAESPMLDIGDIVHHAIESLDDEDEENERNECYDEESDAERRREFEATEARHLNGVF